jgi:CheY-like chemotaxis protein
MAKKILLVDDDKDLVESLVSVLKQNGFDVVDAYSGVEGLKKLIAEKPDLVILDVMMETDTAGFEVVYQIRSTMPTSKYRDQKNIPIIMLTAIDQVTNSRFSLNESQSFLPSINDFLTKPVKVNELIEKIKKFV